MSNVERNPNPNVQMLCVVWSLVSKRKNIRCARRGGFFPLTPALSLGERVKPALPGAQSRTVAVPLHEARGSLSHRERVRVRGTGANYRPAYRTNPATVELIESSGIAGGLPKWRITSSFSP